MTYLWDAALLAAVIVPIIWALRAENN